MTFNLFKNYSRDLKQFNTRLVLALVFIFSFQTAFSQSEEVEIISHKVALGETMLMISKKYLVSPTEIYRLNKKAIDGVSEGMILYIPQPVKSQEIIAERIEKREKEKLALLERQKEREERELAEAKNNEKIIAENTVSEGSNDDEYKRREAIAKLNVTDKNQYIEHEVASGETLNNLSKKYGVSVDEIEKVNEKTLKKGLQAGQTLKMPVAKNLFIQKDPIQLNDNKTEISHKVVAGETLYSISKTYGVSVDEISNANESILKNGLKTGQTLKIKTSKVLNSKTQVSEDLKPTTDELNIVENSDTNEYITIKHQVEAKETLYSISKKYNVSVDEIKQQNEVILAKGLQTGQEIIIKLKK